MRIGKSLVPVVAETVQEDRGQVTTSFVLKFLQYGGSGALASISEVNAVYQVCYQHDGVDNGEQPAHYLVETGIFLPMEREEEKQNKQRVAVENGGRVEDDTGAKQAHSITETQVAAKNVPIDQYEGQSADEVDDVDENQIPDEGQEICHVRTLFHIIR